MVLNLQRHSTCLSVSVQGELFPGNDIKKEKKKNTKCLCFHVQVQLIASDRQVVTLTQYTFSQLIFTFALECNPTWMRGNFGQKLHNSPKLPHIHGRLHCCANEKS